MRHAFIGLLALITITCIWTDFSPQARAEEGHASELMMFTPAGIRSVPVRSWREIRDNDIVKQSKDYSCGSAAIATILSAYYGRPTTEEDVLIAIDRGDLRATFLAMQGGLTKLGFRAIGVAASFEQLQALQMPVIVFVRYRNSDHFTVVRGVGPDTILVADPSVGERTFSNAQFREMWETRTGGLPGKLLAIFPLGFDQKPHLSFFKATAVRQTRVAKRLIVSTAAGR